MRQSFSAPHLRPAIDLAPSSTTLQCVVAKCDGVALRGHAAIQVTKSAKIKRYPCKVLNEATGEDISTRAMMEYFKPLMSWLEEQNKGRQIGWEYTSREFRSQRSVILACVAGGRPACRILTRPCEPKSCSHQPTAGLVGPSSSDGPQGRGYRLPMDSKSV